MQSRDTPRIVAGITPAPMSTPANFGSTFALVLMLLAQQAYAGDAPIEVHQMLIPATPEDKLIALTLDACGGGYDADLIRFLVDHRIPATLFVTRRWLQRQPGALAVLRAHADLFEIEDHGDRHVPAVIGAGRSVYGILGNANADELRREVTGGALAIAKATGTPPTWYRGATGEYDPGAITIINKTGFQVAGFSLNADDGATLPKEKIVQRIEHAQSGDIILAHMNRPEADTAEGLAVGLQQLLQRGFRFITLRDAQVQFTSETARRLPHRTPSEANPASPTPAPRLIPESESGPVAESLL